MSINKRQGLLSDFATLRYVLQNMVAHVVSNSGNPATIINEVIAEKLQCHFPTTVFFLLLGHSVFSEKVSTSDSVIETDFQENKLVMNMNRCRSLKLNQKNKICIISKS